MSIEDHFKLIVGHRSAEIAYIGGEIASVLPEARSTNLKRELGCFGCKARQEFSFQVPNLIVATATPAEMSRCPSLRREIDISGCQVLRFITHEDDSLLPSTGCGSRLKRHSHPMPVSRP